LKQKIANYEGMTVEWIGGHEPEAWLYSGPDESTFVKKLPLPDAGAEQLAKLFAENGFLMKRAQLLLSEPTKVETWNGKTYRVYAELYDFETVQLLLSPPAQVLTIRSEEENAWLNSWLEEGKHYWLGASDAADEGVWTWDGDSSPFFSNQDETKHGYSAWDEGEPNNSNVLGYENCAVFGAGGGRWVDRPCSERHQLVTEILLNEPVVNSDRKFHSREPAKMTPEL